MNHRVLLILSITAILVGIVGISLQNKNNDNSHREIVRIEDVPQTIMLAEALRDLQAGEILQPEDYKITTLTVPSKFSDARDISTMSGANIRGYLVKSNVARGSFLTSLMLLSPESKNYFRESLGQGEMPYSFPITSADDYLISSTHPGDKLAIYIRIREVEKGKTERIELTREGSQTNNNQIQKNVVTQVFNKVTVLDSKRFKEIKNTDTSFMTNNKIIGSIILRLNQKQLAILRTIETSGQLFLMPDSKNHHEIMHVSIDDVLPQLQPIIQLRGGTK